MTNAGIAAVAHAGIAARMRTKVPFIAMSCGSDSGMSGAGRSRMGFPFFGELIAVANRMALLKT